MRQSAERPVLMSGDIGVNLVKKSLIILLAACQLGGCASAGNHAALERYKVGCAQGNAHDCASVPYQEQVNQAEALQNAGKAAAIAVLLPIIILATMADVRACTKFGYC
jgi:hypothetical protein